MPTVRMTDRFVAAAKVGEAIRLGEFYDEVTSGLVLRVTRGAKGWSFFYTTPATGTRGGVGLGHYPQTSLAAARARAIEAAELVENGEDPRAAFAARARSAATIAHLVESYLALHVRARKRRRGSKIERELRSASKIERRLRKNVLPVIGDVRLADLHRRDITRVTDALLRRGSPRAANPLFSPLRPIFHLPPNRAALGHTPTAHP